jgi:GNAT superfamily N-acetyltransferase
MADYSLEPFDPRAVDDTTFEQYWTFAETIRAERLPDDPPVPLQVLHGRYRGAPPYSQFAGALVRIAGGPPVAAAIVGYDTSGENAHLANLELGVLAPHRRQGLGRRLLRFAAETARAADRRLLLGFSSSLVSAGEQFARAAGAAPGLEERHSQLVLADLDRAMLRQWQERAGERAADFELLSWESDYPEEHLAAFADLSETMNTAPRENLDVEDMKITPEKARQWLAMVRSSGLDVWTLVARERSTGALAGYTELFLHPERPSIVSQGATAVRPEYRNRGLGRLLKAAMLEKLLAERPQARFVRTDNAESNAPMLAINVALGFKPFMTVTIWQLEVEQALAFAGA